MVEKRMSPGAADELGVTGLKIYSGVVNEEFLSTLSGPRGVRVYRQMADNDSTVGAVLMAVDLLVRAVEWKMEPIDDSQPAKDMAHFADGVFSDMEQPFSDFISEAMTMLVYGWSWFEVVLKRRLGPGQRDPRRRSAHSDGLIGIRKLAPRSQDSLNRWEVSDQGDILGMWQSAVTTAGGPIFLPYSRSLLFRTKSDKNNPEGRSVLRNAYRSWYLLKTIQDSEAIGIERELAGLPVAYIPSKYMRSDATAADQAFYAAVKQIVRDVKFNEQGGVILPSDLYPTEDDKLTNEPMVRLELLSTGGRRQIDTGPVVLRYQRDIARSVLADFMMLGQDRGAFNLADSKTDLFLRACETYLGRIADTVNRTLLPRLWEYNGMDKSLMPRAVPGHIAPTNLDELGMFIERISRAGMPLFPDEKLERHVREESGLPLERGESAATNVEE